MPQTVKTVAAHIPMKRELKGLANGNGQAVKKDVAAHIPMKRELKVNNIPRVHAVPRQ